MVLLALSVGAMGARGPAPSPKQVLVYAPQTADHMVYLNVQAILPSGMEMLKALPKEPFIAEFPDAINALNEGIRQLDGAIQTAQGKLGFNPVKDLKFAVAWVRYKTDGPPDWLLVVRGKLGKDPLGTLGGLMGGQMTELRGRPAMRMGPVLMMHGADGALLLGSAAWVEERSLATWTRMKPKGVSKLAASALKNKPFIMLASHPSDTARGLMHKGLDHEDLAIPRAVMTRHEHMVMWLSPAAIGWEWKGRDADSYDNGLLASEGLIELMRAGQLGVRGLTRLVLAGLSAYRDRNPMIHRLLKHRDALLGFVLKHSGDGSFKAKVKGQKGKRLVSVVAKGGSLDSVLPIGAGLPLFGAAAAWLVVGRAPMDGMEIEGTEEEKVVPVAPPEKEPAPEPLDEGGAEDSAPEMDVDPARPPISPNPKK